MPAPDPELETLIRDGKLVLGGCIIFDGQPDYRCNECGWEFRADGRPGASEAATDASQA